MELEASNASLTSMLPPISRFPNSCFNALNEKIDQIALETDLGLFCRSLDGLRQHFTEICSNR